MSDPAGTAGAVQYYVNSSTFGGDKDKLFLDTSNVRLGIGTDAPLQKIHIQDTTGDVILGVDADSGSGDSVLALRNSVRIWNVGMDHSDDDKLVIAVGGNWNNIGVTGRDVMTMTYGGRVGIGTSAPDTMLDLAQGGAITLRGNQNAIQFRDASDNLDFLVGQRSDIVADDFVFHSYGGDWAFSSGNVGIGTTSPDSLLEVSGADESQIKVTGASGAELVLRASASTVTVGSNTNHNLYLRTNNTARVTINGSSGDAAFNGSRLDLQNASDTHMSVVSTGSVASFTVQAGEANTASITISSDDGDDASDITLLEQSNGGPFKIKTNNGGSTAISCDSGGNVAIKQASASYALDVNGVVNCSSLRFADGTSISTTPTGTVLLRDLNPAAFNYDLHVAGNVGIGTTSPSYNGLHIKPASGNGQLVVEKASAASCSINAQSSLVQIGTISNHPLQLTVNSTAYVHLTTGGNVGIGTTSPGKLLELSNAESVIRMSSSSGKQYDIASGGGVGTTANDFAIINQSDGGTAFRIKGGSSSDGALVINAGKVGIGTTTPKRSLHIHTSSAASCFLQVTNGSTGSSSDGDGFQLGIGTTGGAQIIQRENLPLTISTNNTERLTISAVGNVGIGATSPLSALHIRKSANLGTNFQEPRNGDTAIRFDIPNYTNNIIVPMLEAAHSANNALPPAVRVAAQMTSNGSKLIFGTSNSYSNGVNNNALSIGHDARVGINHTTPGATLDIYKSPHYSTNTVVLRRADNNSKYAIWNYNTATCHFGTHANDNLGFITNNATHMTITSAGNVGVGTTSPSYKLDVDGTIRCNTLLFKDGTSFSSVGQVGNKAIAVNIGNGSSNVAGRAKSVVDASYGGIENGLVLVYYYYHYHSRCGNGGCTRTAYAKQAYQVTDGNWSGVFGF